MPGRRKGGNTNSLPGENRRGSAGRGASSRILLTEQRLNFATAPWKREHFTRAVLWHRSVRLSSGKSGLSNGEAPPRPRSSAGLPSFQRWVEKGPGEADRLAMKGLEL